MTVAEAIKLLEKIKAIHGEDAPVYFQLTNGPDGSVALDAIDIPNGSTAEVYREAD